MLIRLCSYSLFNLADDVLNFSGVLFSNAISFQVGVLRDLAGLLLDCSFDFVKLAGCLIFCARFHCGSLLCSVVVVDSLRSTAVIRMLTVCDQVIPSLEKFPCPMQSLVLTSIELSDR